MKRLTVKDLSAEEKLRLICGTGSPERGLSYASFTYGNLCLTQIEGLNAVASFTVANTSDVDGMETAQLYIQPCASLVYRPKQELKGYKKKTVPAGATVSMEIPIDGTAFRYWSSGEDRWAVDDGDYQLLIGASSRDIRLSLLIRIQNGKLIVVSSEE